MIDAHCHLDLYSRPIETARQASNAGVITICVTNLPSAFVEARSRLQSFPNIRVALGLHPLLAEHHVRERSVFQQLSDTTSYIGEVGLDFSREGYATREIQIESLRLVLEQLQDKPKFITVHSRRAENLILDMLKEMNRSPVVFHWYSGSLRALDRALEDGHYFSVNSAMIQSDNGRKTTVRIPKNRLLTETDGPFVKINGHPAIPQDVKVVEAHLGKIWGSALEETSHQIKLNLMALLEPLRTNKP